MTFDPHAVQVGSDLHIQFSTLRHARELFYACDCNKIKVREYREHGETYSSSESGEGPRQDGISGTMYAGQSRIPERAEQAAYQER